MKTLALIPQFVLVFFLQIQSQEKYFMTVNGKLPASKVKMVLEHEHIVTNFVGADSIKKPPLDKTVALEIIVPYFNRLKLQGVNLLMEYTPAYLGRDPLLLKEIADKTGINIVTNTGFYAAVDKKYLPPLVYNATIEKIAGIWEDEFKNGIDGTSIRPGFIKLSVGNGKLDSIESKLLKAGIMVSKRTGLTIAVHTGDFEAANDEYQIVVADNHDPSKLVWVHAQHGTNDQRKQLAEKGVWISMDGVNENKLEEYIEAILFFKEKNLLHRLLISQDDGWSVVSNGSYDLLELFDNGNIAPYESILVKLIPALKKKGISDQEINLLMRTNPVNCFALNN